MPAPTGERQSARGRTPGRGVDFNRRFSGGIIPVLRSTSDRPAHGILTALALLLVPGRAAAGQTLRIFHIDVDQASATLLVAPGGKTLLIDSGKNNMGGRLRAVLAEAGATRIDFFVDTHYHEDHFGGIDELFKAPVIPVGKAYDRGDKAFVPDSVKNKPVFKNYMHTVGNGAEALTRGKTIPLDPLMTVTSIAAGGAVLGETNPPQPSREENDMSVSLLITFAGFRYFIGGDTETQTEEKIAARDLVTDVDVYVADHHGAENGSSQDLLDDMRPNVIVISNGSTTVYDHPRKTTLTRMEHLIPAPVIFQTNKYLHEGEAGDQGGNVDDQFIGDLTATGTAGTIRLTVDAGAANYVVGWRGQTRTFAIKHPAAAVAATGGVVIESLLPDPTGPDAQDEEVTIQNKGALSVALTGWVLRDRSGLVWALASGGTLTAGQSATFKRKGMPMSLNNDGDGISLVDPSGAVKDQFAYASSSLGARIQTGHL